MCAMIATARALCVLSLVLSPSLSEAGVSSLELDDEAACEVTPGSDAYVNVDSTCLIQARGRSDEIKSIEEQDSVKDTSSAVPDTSQIAGAKLLNTGLCKSKGKKSCVSAGCPVDYHEVFKQRRIEVLQKYSQAFSKEEDVGLALGAILELEECGIENELAGQLLHNNFARSKSLRDDLLTELRKSHERNEGAYANAKDRIAKALQWKSRDGRVVKPINEQIRVGKWFIDEKDAQSCVETCEHVGLHCDVQMMENLVSDEAVRAAVETIGHSCTSSEEIIFWEDWDGPYLKDTGTKQGRCFYSPLAFTNCNKRVLPSFKRLCACSETTGPTIASARPGMFAHIVPALPLGDNLLTDTRGDGGEDRGIVGSQTLKKLGSECIVYAFGVAYEYGYEQKIVENLGCTVHSFDCTMINGKKLMEYLNEITPHPNIVYHPWCVGEHGSQYKGWDGNNTGIFLSLEEIMAKLGHKEVDIVKFDIEGNEWKLFDTLLSTRKELLPNQLAFEIHTYGARKNAVPEELVGKKGERETAELFNRLYDAGYMLVSKEVNVGDAYCAEMVMAKIPSSS